MTSNNDVFSSAQHNVSSVTTSAFDSAVMATNSIKLLTGNSHPELAKAVAKRFVTIRAAGGRLHIEETVF